MMNLSESQTKQNLMAAFAGESQARSRYSFAAGLAKQQQLHVVQAVFSFTAKQEREHAEVFYGHLSELHGSSLSVDAEYPVTVTNSIADLLAAAVNGEHEEADTIYPQFAAIAAQEGFSKIAKDFENIALIERTHAKRFATFADWIKSQSLFVATTPTDWVCLNCGHAHHAESAPKQCPVCSHPQGYFIRADYTPYQ